MTLISEEEAEAAYELQRDLSTDYSVDFEEESEFFKQYDPKPKNFKQVFGFSHLNAKNNYPSSHICPNCSSKVFSYAANLGLYWCLHCDSFFKDEAVNA